MARKIKNNRKTYVVQCSGCKKILPRIEASRRELEQLVMLEDLIKDWVLGKISIFSEMPISVKKFLQESIHGYIENHVWDIAFDGTGICKCGCTLSIKQVPCEY